MSILDFVPDNYELRDNQPEILRTIEAEWKSNDIFVLVSDVGTGKSVILQTIARWQAAMSKTVATITPQVILQDQYGSQFPGLPLLKGANRYECRSELGLSCKEYKTCEEFYCKGCVYKKSKEVALNSKNAVFNLQSYILSQQTREVLLVDEAHMLFSLLSELYTVEVWKHKYSYPDNLNHCGDVLIWIEKTRGIVGKEIEDAVAQIDLLQKQDASKTSKEYKKAIANLNDLQNMDKKLAIIFSGVELRSSGFFIEHTEGLYRNKKMDMLRMRPKTLDGMPLKIFGNFTKKLVLATATMHDLDLKKLGLDDKRVKFLSFNSPLLAVDRPIIVEFAGNMSYAYQDKNLPKLARKIEELRERHIDTKGLVHCSYAMAEKLQELLPRLSTIVHNTLDKDIQLKKFKEAPAGTIFLASGMSMGLDLAGEDYGWQAITKIMYPSQADELVKLWYEEEPEWILWLTAKDLIQACGRINRYKGDKGSTYILDSSFGNPKTQQYGLYQKAARLKFLPSYFLERIKW